MSISSRSCHAVRLLPTLGSAHFGPKTADLACWKVHCKPLQDVFTQTAGLSTLRRWGVGFNIRRVSQHQGGVPPPSISLSLPSKGGLD